MVHLRPFATASRLGLASLLALNFVSLLPAASPSDAYASKIRSAHVVWEKDSKRISELLDKLREHVKTLNGYDKDLKTADEEIRQLARDLARQLAEMAEGKFCSRCLSIASDIQRGGQSFQAHLDEVDGVALPASPEQLEKARQQNAEKVAKVRERIAELEKQKKAATTPLNEALHELTARIPAYHQHITAEKTLHLAAWGDESVTLKEKLETLQTQQQDLAKQPASDARDVQARALEAQLRSALGATSAAEARAAQTAMSFSQGARTDMEALARKAATIPAGQPLVDGWTLSHQITGQVISYVALPVAKPAASAAAQLLKGNPTSSNPTPPAQKSVSDLLKGK